MKRLIVIALALGLCLQAGAVERQDGKGSGTSAEFPFRAFRPMYFIGGIPLSGPIDKSTIGFKFQFSTALPLWKNISGREGLDLCFGYSQVSVWDFFDTSSPFRENCFIPGFYLSVPLGRDFLMIGAEHRSNGRPMRGTVGDTFSRSTNYIYGEYGAFFPSGLVLKANVRAGFGWYDSEFTQEVFWRFQGYSDFTAGYKDDKWQAAATVTPIFGPFGVNIKVEAARRIKIFSVFLQFNYGYTEALSEWVRGTRPAPYLRFGILFGDLL